MITSQRLMGALPFFSLLFTRLFHLKDIQAFFTRVEASLIEMRPCHLPER